MTQTINYPYETLETLYADISLAQHFLSRAESLINKCDAPVDELYERIENAFAEVDDLYSYICKATNRERIIHADTP